MKTLFTTLRPASLAILCALVVPSAAMAQKRDVPVPSKDGYWVVESAKQPTRQTVVRFYNTDNKLLYEERLSRKRLNIRRTKTVIRLNEALDEAMSQWTMTKQIRPEQNLVAAQFRK
ncbi:hypothetical protein GCM10023187_51500 [Nibrella viscosa]|uniref:Lipocalin-like domain-containing protein n=1 Tax=Nibrella viscosa TaxID=1084524 RepID=A0ABP8KYR5_9BACT